MLDTRTSMRLRGYAKIVLICVLMNQVITSLFAFFATQIDPATPSYIITGFGVATCGLMGFWLQGDMLRAYKHAKTNGCIREPDDKNASFAITQDCPRRWLVILYIELNPAIIGA